MRWRMRAVIAFGSTRDHARYARRNGKTRSSAYESPRRRRQLAPYTLRPRIPAAKPPFNRIAYAAAHVVADPLADGDPWLDAAIDWERTIAFRRHLWSLGLGVAEAMDTAQRGMGARLADLARADPPQPRRGAATCPAR